MNEKMKDAEEALEMTKRLLSTHPDDLLLMIRESKNNIRIQSVIVSAYKARCRDLLEAALK